MTSAAKPYANVLISVASPVRNAEDWIESYLKELSAVLSENFKDYEIVVVDNSSFDRTVQIIESLQKQYRNIQLYCLARPIPHESAFVVALEQAIGDVVITLDAAYDPVAPIPEMLNLWEGDIDVVYGLRTDRLQGKFNLYNWLSKLFFKFYSRITRENFPIAVSTLRLYSRRAMNSFLDNSDRYNLFPVIAAFSGLAFKVFTYQRINRTGKPVPQNYLAGFLRALQLTLLSSYVPLRLLSFLSLSGALLNVLYSIYVVLVNIFKTKVAEGWTTLSLQNSMMFFILFMILAILSEYTVRLFISNQKRPLYLITRESRSLVLLRKQEINVVSEDFEPYGQTRDDDDH